MKHKRAVLIILAIVIAIAFTVGVWLRGSHERSLNNTQTPQNSAPAVDQTSPQPSNTTSHPTPRPRMIDTGLY